MWAWPVEGHHAPAEGYRAGSARIPVEGPVCEDLAQFILFISIKA